MSVFTKHSPTAPPGHLEAEAAGLRWLTEPGALPVVAVRGLDEQGLHLEHLAEVTPTGQAARELGRGLARLHDAGAPGFGWAPASPAFFGPLSDPFEVPTRSHERFAVFWAEDRLLPLVDQAAPRMGAEGDRAVREAIAVIAAGAFDGIAGQGREAPARVHGDLWAGNVLWTAGGATLIDPAAHGGHRLEDLAMLSLFGAPHLDEIYAGYEQAHPLPRGWREDLPAHLFFGLLAHVVLFGSVYAAQTVRVARRIVARGRALSASPAHRQ